MNQRLPALRSLALISAVAAAAALAAASLPAAAGAPGQQPGATAAGRLGAADSGLARRIDAASGGLAGLVAASGGIAGASGGIDGLAAAAGAIAGVVRGVGGVGLLGACVLATGPAGTTPAATRAGGRYLIPRLLPGRYTVSYSDCGRPGRYFGQWYGGAALAAGSAPVLVTAGLPTVLKPVTLRPASHALIAAAASATNRRVGSRTQRRAGPRARRIAQVQIILAEGRERASGQRGGRLVRAGADVGGQHQDRHRRGAHDLLDSLHPIHAGQLDVHGHEIRAHRRQRRNCLLGGAADRHHRYALSNSSIRRSAVA